MLYVSLEGRDATAGPMHLFVVDNTIVAPTGQLWERRAALLPAAASDKGSQARVKRRYVVVSAKPIPGDLRRRCDNGLSYAMVPRIGETVGQQDGSQTRCLCPVRSAIATDPERLEHNVSTAAPNHRCVTDCCAIFSWQTARRRMAKNQSTAASRRLTWQSDQSAYAPACQQTSGQRRSLSRTPDRAAPNARFRIVFAHPAKHVNV